MNIFIASKSVAHLANMQYALSSNGCSLLAAQGVQGPAMSPNGRVKHAWQTTVTVCTLEASGVPVHHAKNACVYRLPSRVYQPVHSLPLSGSDTCSKGAETCSAPFRFRAPNFTLVKVVRGKAQSPCCVAIEEDAQNRLQRLKRYARTLSAALTLCESMMQ